MKNIYIELESNNYNRSNIKYQILFYYPNVNKVEISEDQVYILLPNEEDIDEEIIRKIIDDNKLHVNIFANALEIKTEHLETEEKEYISEQLLGLVDFLKDKSREELLDDILPESKGVNMLSNEAGILFKKLDEAVANILKKIFNAEEYWVPSIISVEELQKSNYLGGSFHHVNYISKMKRNYDNIGDFRRQSITNTVDKEFLTNCTQVLNPAVCLHCYPLLKGKNIKNENRAYTLIGKSYRDESGNLDNTTRLKEFTMRELVYIGQKNNTEIIFEKCLEVMNMFGTVLNLSFNLMPANDIFFDDNIGKKTVFQKALNNKIELEVFDKTLELNVSVASTNRHGTHFSKGYNIQTEDELATSMCLAFGYDRILRILIDQYCK